MNTTQLNILKLNLQVHGAEHQTMLAFEEMAELQNALCKLSRGRATQKEVIEEIADVLITATQLAIHYGMDQVQDEINYKLQRLASRLINSLNHKQNEENSSD